MRDDWRSPIPLRERIEAASAAGFRGFGMVFPDLVEAERQYGMAAIRGMLDDNGLVHVELEGLLNWWTDGPKRMESDRVRAALLSAAEKLGARRLKVTPDDSGDPWDLDHWAAEFRTLASLFEDTVNRRRYCGEGSFDLQADIRALRCAGWTGPWGIESLSEDHRRLDVQTAASRAYSTGLAQLELTTAQ